MSKLAKTAVLFIPIFFFGLFFGFIIDDTSIFDSISNENSIQSFSQNMKPINIEEHVSI